ncbi:unnamed protein product [Adineta steineri]|uniref:Shisa N-terminal domain-containing protein n=1 Tax=Adineta steineri TaxID=433720 RepID=A0A813RQ78_9BILA|nr:unnamed protein product [Adineta steineri]CAF0784053.1 unnamed protein product [Adineta steineri]CAF0851897.1 unnamed protein product [Adineta steineri]CAF3504231.1 unnamed protein product [Adineta steineri]CAF3617562.1 unnamed protein product [Adineta steineri]
MNPDDQRTSCPGFLDEFGVWNNGFECPPLTGQIRICCESDSRRYCCTLDNFHKTSSPSSSFNLLNSLGKNSYSTVESSLLLNETKSSTILTLPIILICFVILIITFLLIFLSICFWYRYQNRNSQRKQQENLSTKTNLLIDHFPFSPPHHQFFLNDNNSLLFNNKSSLIHQQTRDTLTTTTIAPSSTTSTSSTSGRIPSDIYYNDWKDFLIAADQPMNVYPTMSSHSIELNNDQQYQLYYGKRQQNDVIV